MKRVWKYLFRTVLIVFVLLLLLPAVFYIPAVQRFVKNKAVEYVTANLGMQASIDRFTVGFPFNVNVEGAFLGRTATDTMVYVKQLELNVGVWRLLRKQLAVEKLSVNGVKVDIRNDTTGMRFQVDLERLDMTARRVNLGMKRAEIDSLGLSGGKVFLMTGKSTKDTVASKPFDWVFAVTQLTFADVDFRMQSEALPLLVAGGKSGRITRGTVDIGGQQVVVDSVDLKSGYCFIRQGNAASEPVVKVADKTVSEPWTVNVNTVLAENNAFRLSSGNKEQVVIELTGIGVRIDSVYNRGTVVKARLRQLQAVQPEGIHLEQMKAYVDLDTALTQVRGAYILTKNSELHLDAGVRSDLSGMLKTVPLDVRISGTVGLADVAVFVKQLPQEIISRKVNVDAVVAVTEDKADITRFILSMPGSFTLNSQGKLSSLRHPDNISGVLSLSGDFQDMAFLEKLAGGGFRIPQGVHLSARLKAESGRLQPDVVLNDGKGQLILNGSYGLRDKAYDLLLKADSLHLGRFLTSGKLGLLTAEVKAEGKGLQWGKAVAQAGIQIKQLYYDQHLYRNLELDAELQKSKLTGVLKSGDPDLLMALDFAADSVGRRMVAELNGKIQRVDLFALNFTKTPIVVSMEIGVKAAAGKTEDYLLHTEFNDIRMDNGIGAHKLGDLMLHLDSDRQGTALNLISGDFNLAFNSAVGIQSFIRKMGEAVHEANLQVAEGKIDVERIRQVAPEFNLDAKGEGNDVVGRYLHSQGINYRGLQVKAGMTEAEGFYLNALLRYPNVGKIQPDSVVMWMQQKGNGLDYAVDITNTANTLQDIYKLNMSGYIRQDQAGVNLKQQNRQGETGVDFGLVAVLQDSTVTVSLNPLTPILGYSRWIVNPGNHITFLGKRKVTADLKLAYQDKLIRVESLADESDRKDRLQVEVKGIDLQALSASTPFIPDMAGILNTDLSFYSQDKRIVADGDLNVKDFYYNRHRIGTMELDMNYMLDSGFVNHAVDFTLHLDSIKRALVKGKFSTLSNGKMIVDVDIPSLPLYVVNAFTPENLLDLSGEMVGKMDIRGTFKRPDITGFIGFSDGRVNVLPLGTTFRLDSTRIVVRDDRVVFNRYSIISPNRQPLLINGNVALRSFSDIRVDVSLSADNFQLVDVKQNPNTLVYGKAFVSMNATARGALNALKVSGDINLLNNTLIDYVLRSSGPQLKDRSVDLVRFVSFADTTLNEKDNLTNRLNMNSFSIQMLVEIGNAVKMNIDLSEDGSNRVEIQGGGNLVYTMNDEGLNSLIGKYTLTGGTVRYSIPVVGEKNFTIQSGSYVEWTGDLMNPALNITASEAVKAVVSEDNQNSRLVNFDAIIRIQNNLQRPEITFDLSSPNDQSIQSQLAAQPPEERTKQALNLLIYGTYSGPGAISSSNAANNTLNNFIEKELNQWSRKYLKNTGLTFGVDSYNQYGSGGQEVQRTDYSYQFSKQFFNDRVNVKIGGRISTDNDPASAGSMEQNLVDDIAIEYVFDKNRSLYLKVFRHTNYESVLDGEVTQTGAGIVWRKSFRKVKDLFIRKSKREAAGNGQLKVDN